MKESVKAYKNAKVDEILGSIKKSVLHAFNCGYEAGFKDGKIACLEALTEKLGDINEVEK